MTVHCRIGRVGWEPSEFRDWAVQALQPFELRIGEATVVLDPRVEYDAERADLAPLLRLIRRGVDEPRWAGDGTAVLPLKSGSLTFPTHTTEAPWTITGPWGQVWRCLPGGVVVDADGSPAWRG